MRKLRNKQYSFLEFHHQEKDKENSISQILDSRFSIFIKEVEKCKVLCSNCHAELHCNGDSENGENGGSASLNKTNLLKFYC